MMDAKKALTATDGDYEAAVAWLRERGLGKAAERAGRENDEGAVAVHLADGTAALVELKSESDFVAKSPQFVDATDRLARAVAADGEGAVADLKDLIDDLRLSLKENIEVGKVVRFAAEPGHTLDTYLHLQNGRGVNGVIVELGGGTPELAHDIAVHIAFGRPGYLRREDVPADEVAAERTALEAQTRNEGKPEQALPKIVEGKLGGWYKRVPGGVLLEQPYARDDKQTVAQVLDGAQIIRFAQATVGA
jgi:elongation factor Ts